MAVTDEVKDSYELSSGGFVPEFDGVVREAQFTFDNSYMNGEACLLELLVEPSEDDAPEFGDYLEDGLYRIIYPCGKGFEPADKGATVQHESGRPRRFNTSSGIGLLVAAALECEGVADVLMERGPSTQADIWVGLNFHWLDKEFSRTDKNGDEITWTRRLPVEFHGVDGAEEKKAPAKKAPAKKAPAKQVEQAEDEAGEEFTVPAALKGKLKAIANTADDHDAFMEAAFSTLDIPAEHEDAVASEAFFLSLKAG